MPDADIIVVVQNYLIPHLLQLPDAKGRIVNGVAMDYQAMLNDKDTIARDWSSHMVSIERATNIPRFAVSLGAKEGAEAIGIPVQRVIRLGVNLEEFTAPSRLCGQYDPVRVMLFCAMHEAKGQDSGCAVVRLLRECYDRSRMVLISLGQVKEEYASLFDENLGYLLGNDYAMAYQHADIVIYPSLRDGFPAPPLEAMASGCALATTAVSGVVEYAVHERNCLVSDPSDVPAMVNNVQKLIEDREMRKRLSLAGPATAAQYTWQKSTEELVDFLNVVQSSPL
ncbi:glycosyltransferase family 4 protein [Candidatus Uhrbacteria bacterium]|nr:glycosyltransferase family 4 protein [Candidatus Uhrbacteria bacterium]